MDRDSADLYNADLAVYNYRGYTIVSLNKKTKCVDIGRNAHMCNLIDEDLTGIAAFLTECLKYRRGEVENVTTVEVN